MNTNDVLRRLRFAVQMNDAAMLEMLRLAGADVSREALASYFLKEDEEGYAVCLDATLASLLDGLILKRRGPKPAGSGAAEPVQPRLDNNMILKKIRIALELKEEDMIAIMRLAGVELSRNELSALFRRSGQRNYMECMDQFLRNFLAGLAQFKKPA